MMNKTNCKIFLEKKERPYLWRTSDESFGFAVTLLGFMYYVGMNLVIVEARPDVSPSSFLYGISDLRFRSKPVQ
jgi:hypothetical protein